MGDGAHGPEIAAALRQTGQALTTFEGQGRSGPRILLYVHCPRRAVQRVLRIARGIDADVFVVIERAVEGDDLPPALPATGWRAFLKRK